MDSFCGPNGTQTILNDTTLADTHRPFQQDHPVYTKGKLWKRSHIVLNSPITQNHGYRKYTEAPELGIPR